MGWGREQGGGVKNSVERTEKHFGFLDVVVEIPGLHSVSVESINNIPIFFLPAKISLW